MPRIIAASDPAETALWLDEMLNDQAEQAVGKRFRNDLVTFEAWEGNTRLGGIHAKFGTDWVFIELLALTDAGKGSGTGRQLLQSVEAEAQARGKTGIWLDTYSFQAPGFYRRLGYEEIGRIDNYPDGHSRYFFAKRLDGQPIRTAPKELS